MPPWEGGYKPNPPSEPVIKTLSQDGWIAAAVRAVSESSYWNRRGAIWSGIAVALTGLSTVASAIGY